MVTIFAIQIRMRAIIFLWHFHQLLYATPKQLKAGEVTGLQHCQSGEAVRLVSVSSRRDWLTIRNETSASFSHACPLELLALTE